MATGNREALVPVPVVGETRVGSQQAKDGQGVFYIESGGQVSVGSVLALDSVDSSGNIKTWYIWVTSGGVIKGSATFPANTETATGTTIATVV